MNDNQRKLLIPPPAGMNDNQRKLLKQLKEKGIVGLPFKGGEYPTYNRVASPYDSDTAVGGVLRLG